MNVATDQILRVNAMKTLLNRFDVLVVPANHRSAAARKVRALTSWQSAIIVRVYPAVGEWIQSCAR